MIPAIMRKEVARLEPGLSAVDRLKQSDKEAAAIIGFTSAVAAFGAFFIPKSFGSSISMTGGAEARALRLPRLLRELHRRHLVVLHAARRPAVRRRARRRPACADLRLTPVA